MITRDNESNIKFNQDSSKETFEIYILPKQYSKTGILLECKQSNGINKIIEDANISAQHAQEIINNKIINGIGYGITFFKK